MARTTQREPRNAATPLNLESSEARGLVSGIAPFSSLSGAAMDADATDANRSVEAADARLSNLVEELGIQRRRVQTDKTLSAQGKRERFDALALEAARQGAEFIRAAAGPLADRIGLARDRFGGSSEMLSGAEVGRILGNGRADAASSLPFVLNTGAMNRAADELVRLAAANDGERLSGVIHEAAAEGEPITLAALDHGLAPFQRAHVLAVALITPKQDGALHRRFRAARNPEAAAEAASLVELARHLIGNGRAAAQMAAKAAGSSPPQGILGHVDGAIERLVHELVGIGEDVSPAPALDPR